MFEKEEGHHIFIPFLLVGLGLSFFSLKATGNVVSNLTGTTQGVLGLLFFLVGLIGLLFFSRKKSK